MNIPFITFEEAEPLLDWISLAEALANGHARAKASIGDTYLYRGQDTMLSRSAWVDGLGIAVKTANIFPGNSAKGKPAINGSVCHFSDDDGSLEALVDFHLINKWKTAGDSLLGALRLANPDSREILIVGAGAVGASLIEAFKAGFPNAQIRVWNRTASKAADLCELYPGTSHVADLKSAVGAADIVLTCTMASDPVIKGEWLRPGQHLNLIGAYLPDMREVDDEAIKQSVIFCDSFETTVESIGEFMIPLSNGVINHRDLRADFYQLDEFPPYDPDQITLFKNGGGAHLDLMTSHYILQKWKAAQVATS